MFGFLPMKNSVSYWLLGNILLNETTTTILSARNLIRTLYTSSARALVKPFCYYFVKYCQVLVFKTRSQFSANILPYSIQGRSLRQFLSLWSLSVLYLGSLGVKPVE